MRVLADKFWMFGTQIVAAQCDAFCCQPRPCRSVPLGQFGNNVRDSDCATLTFAQNESGIVPVDFCGLIVQYPVRCNDGEVRIFRERSELDLTLKVVVRDHIEVQCRNQPAARIIACHQDGGHLNRSGFGIGRYRSDDDGNPVVGHCNWHTLKTGMLGTITGDKFVVVMAGEQFLEQWARGRAGNLPSITSSDGLDEKADARNKSSQAAVFFESVFHYATVVEREKQKPGVEPQGAKDEENSRNCLCISCPEFSVNRNTKVADSGSPTCDGTVPGVMACAAS